MRSGAPAAPEVRHAELDLRLRRPRHGQAEDGPRRGGRAAPSEDYTERFERLQAEHREKMAALAEAIRTESAREDAFRYNEDMLDDPLLPRVNSCGIMDLKEQPSPLHSPRGRTAAYAHYAIDE